MTRESREEKRTKEENEKKERIGIVYAAKVREVHIKGKHSNV